MSVEGHKLYPGAEASPEQVFALAEEYHRVADLTEGTGRRRNLASTFPHRLLTIQAIELYLNAFLLARGHSHEQVRGLQHRMARRGALAKECGLNLRARTEIHLQRLSEDREYLVIRYEPFHATDLSKPNRLRATMIEVANKVREVIKK